MLVATGKIFRFDTSLRHAGYILSVISAISAAALLTNSLPFQLPSGLGFTLTLLGIIPIIVVSLVLLSFAVGVYVWARGKINQWRLEDPFQELFPQQLHLQALPNIQHAHAHLIQPAPPRRRRARDDTLNISDIGREQIARLIKADSQPTARKSKNSEYVFVSSRRKWAEDPNKAIKEATGFDLES